MKHKLSRLISELSTVLLFVAALDFLHGIFMALEDVSHGAMSTRAAVIAVALALGISALHVRHLQHSRSEFGEE